MKRNIGIIPARGGSKRIPRKNVKPFLGKPILCYSIETLLQTGLFEEVMVSTDDEEIAETARAYGAKVPFLRSRETANDFATITDVIQEVLARYEERGRDFDNVCCMLPTSPLTQWEDVKEAYALFEKQDAPAICPVVPFSYPIWRPLKVDGDGKMSMFWPENMNARSQDLEPAYHDSGSFYWGKKTAILQYHTFFVPGCMAWVMDEMRVQDIDNEVDWQLAEMKYRLLGNLCCKESGVLGQ